MNTVLITGNTYPVRKQMHDLGGVWDKANNGWNIPEDNADEAQAIVDAAGPKKAYSRPQRYAKRGGYSRYRSHVYNIGGNEYYRNKAGRCEDAPCCGCCTM